MAELKPCPFCGGEAFVYKRYESVWRNDPTDYTVLCKNCRAGVRHYFQTKGEAIEAWNKRTEPERPKGRWVEIKYEWFPYKCNLCRCGSDMETDFCPNCGADMRGESDV